MILYFQKYTKKCANNIDFHVELRYNSDSGTTQAAITVIAAFRAPLPHTFAAASKFTGHSITKCLLTLETRFCFLKSEGPLK
jgi:hypothetical protein